jgi:hypothetical protein
MLPDGKLYYPASLRCNRFKDFKIQVVCRNTTTKKGAAIARRFHAPLHAVKTIEVNTL